MEIKIKNYDEFIEELKVQIGKQSYEDIMFEGFENAISYALRNIAAVILGEELEILIRETAKEIVLPRIKEKIKEKMTDKVVGGIVESILKEVVGLAKDIEKDSLRLRKYINE